MRVGVPLRLLCRPPGVMQSTISGLREATAINQAFLTAVADAQRPAFSEESDDGDDGHSCSKGGPHKHHHGGSDDCPSPGSSAAATAVVPPLSTSASHHSKVVSTLHQLVRDWSEEGKAERDRCYNPILEELEKRIPITDANRCALVADDLAVRGGGHFPSQTWWFYHMSTRTC